MPNIKLTYEYRDAGNFKLESEIIISNRKDMNESEIRRGINSLLIDEEFFIAKDWGLPNLRFDNYDPELDHDWHRVLKIQKTSENINVSIDICDILAQSR